MVGLIGKTQGMRLIATGTFTAANARNTFDATTAFCEASGLDLSPYAGTDAGSTPYLIELQDASGDVAWGFGGAVGGGEALATTGGPLNDGELITNGAFASDTGWDKEAGWTIPAGGKGVATNAPIFSKMYQTITCSAGVLLKYSYAVTDYTDGNIRYRLSDVVTSPLISSVTTDTGYMVATPANPTARMNIYTAGSDLSIDNVSTKIVTDCAVTGLHIMSARNGTDRGWKVIGSTFGMNDPLTYRVYFLGM